jgi:hypothetical protein
MIRTVVFDESGNTGADLVVSDQPSFVLSSCDFSKDECQTLLNIVLTPQTGEPKLSRIKKSNAGRRRIVEFISSDLINKDRVKVFYIHKEYMALTKVVDLLIENVAHLTGFDLYKKGVNIAMSNMLHYCISAFCGDELKREMLSAFVIMFREKTPASIGKFYSLNEKMIEVSKRHDFFSSLAPIRMSAEIIHEVLQGNDVTALDPAIPGLFSLCSEWGRQYGAEFEILHDHSKPISKEQPNLECLMNPDAQQELVGYDRRQMELPLRCREIKFGDSKVDIRLQVADLIASTCNYWARGLINKNMQDVLWEELNKLDLSSIAAGVLWPSTDVSPAELGTDSGLGSNPIDGVAKHWHKV